MTERGTRRWRLPRLTSLRVFLLICAAAAIGLALVSDQPHRRRHAMESTKKLGGFHQVDDEHRPGHVPLPPPHPLIRRWVIEQLGEHFAHELTVVSLDGKPVVDDDLRELRGLHGLQKLYLNGTKISDRGLAHLSELRGLRKLELRETRVGDPGMLHISRLGELRELYLYETNVTDAGLAHLARLRKLQILRLGKTQITDNGLSFLEGLAELRELDVTGTGVTSAGISRLSNALPNLRITHEPADAPGAGGNFRRPRAKGC